jgi:hypothetical protein
MKLQSLKIISEIDKIKPFLSFTLLTNKLDRFLLLLCSASEQRCLSDDFIAISDNRNRLAMVFYV